MFTGLSGQQPSQMMPNAPVKNFQFPRFAENGYTQWVLRGGQATFESDERILIEAMDLRLYTGDERMAVEMELSSPIATLLLAENSAFSDQSINIKGERFELSGVDWHWTGDDRRVSVHQNSAVSFFDLLPETLASEAPAEEDAAKLRDGGNMERTRVLSESLTLETSEAEHTFVFIREVDLTSEQLKLTSEYLRVLADPPPDRDRSLLGASAPVGALKYVLAREDVVIRQFERTARAGEAEFFPREERVELKELPNITLPGAYLGGDRITLRPSQVDVRGSTDAGRAQLILYRAGGLGLRGVDSLGEETIVLADSIVLTEDTAENRFVFEGNVEVLSGGLRLTGEELVVLTSRLAIISDVSESATLRTLQAKGNVRIEQDGQTAEGEEVEFFPSEARAVLTGRPRIFTNDAEVRGGRIELSEGSALARSGDGVGEVTVTLPQLPDLGYRSPSEASHAAEAENRGETAPTIIRSQRARMDETPAETRFQFSDKVRVEATNLTATGDYMSVLAVPSAQPSGDTAADRLEIENINVLGNVEITQGERVSNSRTALFLPQEGRVILEGDAVVEEAGRGKVTGQRMILLQGERRAIVEGGPDGERARITLPEIPSGF